MGDLTRQTAPEWLALLGALPADARPLRRPVLNDELQAEHSASDVAGWVSLTLHLSAPPIGLRTIVATFDRDGTLLSASDMVHRQHGGWLEQRSVGGRFENDGSFVGTHWEGTAPETVADEDGTADWDLKPTSATPAEGAALRSLVAELERRVTT